MPIHDFTPPLPSEQNGSTIGARHRWLSVWCDYAGGDSEAREDFLTLFGRPPDRVHRDLYEGKIVWWMGWITSAESRWIEDRREGLLL